MLEQVLVRSASSSGHKELLSVERLSPCRRLVTNKRSGHAMFQPTDKPHDAYLRRPNKPPSIFYALALVRIHVQL
jgi:hypothetical protein